jgi:transposase
MREPEEIPDAEHEVMIERVCAIDVAKASGSVCTRLPCQGKADRRVSRVWEVAATTRAVTELADHLVAVGIEKVTVESTSDYWRIWFYLLEAAGLDVQLVNARDVKNLPGRPKTDKLDAVWLAKLHREGPVAALFRPTRPDSAVARLHPAAGGFAPGTRPALAAAGEAAGRRPVD